jgi:hypothetical protein
MPDATRTQDSPSREVRATALERRPVNTLQLILAVDAARIDVIRAAVHWAHIWRRGLNGRPADLEIADAELEHAVRVLEELAR